ncbi:MAG TPA: sugar ABC transporter substrate-binding protein [Ramlibacter sp.]|uniref:ABC transporter substrate-binding protein n=1 Tax=Ramlibacter sp. TaxID=1917967 RepID=UPI002CFA9F3B|nr:sugar ABC transporter substrate-binding protein [Ramlibacter sp.]HVZ43537.1 sugar ABC transporter substrate-binding protein [Ramlibacter sp.]
MNSKPEFQHRSMQPQRRRTMTLSMVALGAVLSLGAALPSHAKEQVTIVYNSFVDPNAKSDPRAQAQTEMIAAFEKKFPDIKVEVFADNTGANAARTVRTQAASPDVIRVPNYLTLEYVQTGSLLPLDDLIARDKIDMKDYLLPTDVNRVGGKTYGLQQDYRIPILIYRKSLLDAAKVHPPATWAEACEAGRKLSTGNVIGLALPLGITGGIGGAQAFGEFMLSSMLPTQNGEYFAADGRAIAFSKASFVRAAQTVKDLFTTCKATPQVSLQYAYNEIHDGLRSARIAMAPFAVYRYRAIQVGGAGDDLTWAPSPAFSPSDKFTVYGYTASINGNSKHRNEAWEFVKFITGREAQVIQAHGGEVVARASAYSDPYFSTPDGKRQKEWAELVKSRGRQVHYSLQLAKFHQIVGEAMQKMILQNASAEDAYEEVMSKYKAALGL